MNWPTYGYGYSAGCRSASGGCASGQRDRPVRAEFHSGRNHWWFRPGLAADRGGVVCAADGVPADCWLM